MKNGLIIALIAANLLMLVIGIITIPPNPRAAAYTPPRGGAGPVGFSDRCSSPEILAAAKKNKKFSVGCM